MAGMKRVNGLWSTPAQILLTVVGIGCIVWMSATGSGVAMAALIALILLAGYMGYKGR